MDEQTSLKAPSARDRRRKAREQAILDAAMCIVDEGGERALTMRSLAKSLDLSPGAMYRYFDGRDAIIAALAQRTISGYAQALRVREEAARRHAAGLPESAQALLVLLSRIECYWDSSVQDPGGWRLINLFLVDRRRLITGPAHDRLMASVSAQIQRLAALCDAAVAVGALQPGNSMERSLDILAVVHGNLLYIKMALTSPIPFEPIRTLRSTIEAVLLGWGAEAAELGFAWERLRAIDFSEV